MALHRQMGGPLSSVPLAVTNTVGLLRSGGAWTMEMKTLIARESSPFSLWWVRLQIFIGYLLHHDFWLFDKDGSRILAGARPPHCGVGQRREVNQQRWGAYLKMHDTKRGTYFLLALGIKFCPRTATIILLKSHRQVPHSMCRSRTGRLPSASASLKAEAGALYHEAQAWLLFVTAKPLYP